MSEARKLLVKLIGKYAPTNGCDNCWGDLHVGCTEQCKQEFKKASEFAIELRDLREHYHKQQLKKDMPDVLEFLLKCGVEPADKIDTDSGGWWRIKDLLEHYLEQLKLTLKNNRTNV